MIIKTARQLKDKIANISGNDSKKSQALIRKYMMERFLCRLSRSKYKDNFVLKGGMLVSAFVGVESRSTMDIDTTVKSIMLTKENAEKIIREIAEMDLDDGIIYEVKQAEEIMQEHDYSGVRLTVTAVLERLRDVIKIDISTGDEIVPSAIEFSYPAMFDNEKINIWSYNIETVLAEKLETVVARSTLNTRMRDFYDIHTLWNEKSKKINEDVLRSATLNVARKRGTLKYFESIDEILDEIENSEYLQNYWNNYKKSNYYVGGLTWQTVVKTTADILKKTIAIGAVV